MCAARSSLGRQSSIVCRDRLSSLVGHLSGVQSRTLTTGSAISAFKSHNRIRLSSLSLASNSPSIPTSSRPFSNSAVKGVSWGFIGLGQMGYPMARSLLSHLSASDSLIIQDANTESAHRFLEQARSESVSAAEVQIGVNARDVAERAQNIITVLPEPQHVRSVYSDMLNPSDLLTNSSLSSPRLFIDCSTIDPVTSGEVAKLAESTKQGHFVDAPMSGGVVGAKAGSLTFMIGCAPELVDLTEAVLLQMGKKVLHLGAQGSGLKGKLANNYLLALNNIATAEAMSMGIKWGLDPAALANMINISTGRCWPSEVNNPVPGVVATAPASRDYNGGFGVALANKDLKLAYNAAKEAGVDMALGPVAVKVYGKMEADERFRTKDFSVVYRYLGGPE